MWYGKLAIIMTIFAFAIAFSMYFVSLSFPTSDAATQASWNSTRISSIQTSLSTLQNMNAGQNPNPALLFGDFLVGATVLFNILSLADITHMLTSFPFWNANMNLAVQIIYGSACGALWVYIIANRSI